MATLLLLSPALFLTWALCACAADQATRESASSSEAGTSASASAGRGSAGKAAAGSSSTDAPVGSFSHLFGQTFSTCKIDFCHGGGRAGLDMSSRDAAYRTLVDMPSSATAACGMLGKKRVVPGEPEQSLLFLKLDINAPCGQQMPPGGVLPESAVQEIHDWIAAGATDD